MAKIYIVIVDSNRTSHTNYSVEALRISYLGQEIKRYHMYLSCARISFLNLFSSWSFSSLMNWCFLHRATTRYILPFLSWVPHERGGPLCSFTGCKFRQLPCWNWDPWLADQNSWILFCSESEEIVNCTYPYSGKPNSLKGWVFISSCINIPIVSAH